MVSAVRLPPVISIDTGRLSEIQEASQWGIVGKYTTNPSLLKAGFTDYRESHPITLEEYVMEILKAASGVPVSLEVKGINYNIGGPEYHIQMAEQGFRLYDRFGKAGNAVIKIPSNPEMAYEDPDHALDGLRAIHVLSSQGIPINQTLIFSVYQALHGAMAGAVILSPFAGRIDDMLKAMAKEKSIDLASVSYTSDGHSVTGVGEGRSDYFPKEGIPYEGGVLSYDGIHSGVHLCTEIGRHIDVYCEGGKFQIRPKRLDASLRNPQQVGECIESGADIVTIPYGVAKESRHLFTRLTDGQRASFMHGIKEYRSPVDDFGQFLKEIPTERMRHPKTLDGMILFDRDTIPEWEALMAA